MKFRTLALLVFFIIPAIVSTTLEASSSGDQILIEELVLSGTDFSLHIGDGLALIPDGLTLGNDTNSSSATSPPILAPIPFNAIVPQWLANLPESTSIEFYIRTGRGLDDWEDWQIIHPSIDWSLPNDKDIVGDMSVVPATDDTHSYVQYRVDFNRENNLAKPLLSELRLVFIDSTAGASVEEMIAQQKHLDEGGKTAQSIGGTAADSYPKPLVISRDVWCTDSRCNYTEGLEYQPITHLILHHTVSGSSGDSAATVRAIWAYHALTRGWDDIGYNFLTDTAGVIYEGHLGGDDVVGIHAGNANAGSMALALIGTYSVVEPPQPMVEAAIDMFAWKADQKDIDVFDASNALPNVAWGLPHIMGHRDVYGTTECPGDDAHAMIPAIRDEVAARIGLVSPYIYVDELSSAFSKSNANWHTPSYQCGHNTHAWYTWSTTNPVETANWGEWRPDIPLGGRYKIEAYIPYCNTGQPETGGANYTIQHAGDSSTVTADQNSSVGLWMSLGEFDLRAGNDNIIRLTDLTTTDDGRGVWFDALRLLKVEIIPVATTQSPTDGSWLNQRQLLFEWNIENPDLVTATTLQVATDNQFQNIIITKEWPSVVESVSHTFVQDYATLYWRVTLTSKSGSDYSSAPSRFGIDTKPPVSAVTSLIWLDWNQQYQVSWHGDDALNEIANYTVEYRRVSGEEDIWQPWLIAVKESSALFSPPDASAVYEFRSQATDTIGNIESIHETADISTEQAISLSHAIILPVIRAD